MGQQVAHQIGVQRIAGVVTQQRDVRMRIEPLSVDRRKSRMLQKMLMTTLGLTLALAYFNLQPGLPLRLVAGGFFGETPWLAATAFFTLPVVTHLLAGRSLSRIPSGTWIAGSWLAVNLLSLADNWDDCLCPARAFASCGNAMQSWLDATYLLPSVCGLALSLLRLGRPAVLSAGPGERQMAVAMEDMTVAVAGEDLAKCGAVSGLV